MFGYDRPASIVQRERRLKAEQLDNPYFDKLFESGRFSEEQLTEMIRSSDPFISRPRAGRDFSGSTVAGYKTFADAANANTLANSLKQRFAKTKDKQAVQQRVDALKELGLDENQAYTNLDNPKYADYFEAKGVAPRVKTYVQHIATVDEAGDKISDRKRRRKIERKFSEAQDFRRRQQEQDADVYLDRRERQFEQDLDFQAALRDEGIKRDYNNPDQYGSRSRSRTGNAGLTAAERKENEDYLALVEEARAQELLSDGSGVNMVGARPEDVIGQGIAKRYSRANAGMAGVQELERQIQEEAARYGGDVKFDDRQDVMKYVPVTSGRDDDYGKRLAAESLNKKLEQVYAARSDYESLMDDAGNQGYILKDGTFYDPRSGAAYRYANNPNEEDEYFAGLPVNQPMVDRGSPSRVNLTPTQRQGIISRIRQLPERGDDEESYIGRFDYYADQVANGNPNAFRSGVAQNQLVERQIQEIAQSIQRGLIPELDLDLYGGDVMAAARDLFKKVGQRNGRPSGRPAYYGR